MDLKYFVFTLLVMIFSLIAGALIGGYHVWLKGRPKKVGTLTLNTSDPASDFMSFHFWTDLDDFSDLNEIAFDIVKDKEETHGTD